MNKICKKCEAKNPSENSFCEKCGSGEFKDPNKPKIVTNTDKQKIADSKYKYTGVVALAFIIIGLWVKLLEDKTHSYSITTMPTNLSDNDTDSAECDYDKVIEYLNREDPNQLDPEQAENLKSCASNNLSLYYKGVTLYCQNGVDSFIIDSSYNVSLIANTAFFTKGYYTVVAASSCRP